MRVVGLNTIWLVGAGPMAVCYAAVLDALDIGYEVIGRSEETAQAFTHTTGRKVRTGGLAAALEVSGTPTFAIVATGVEALAEVTIGLIRAGTRSILVEKPAGLSTTEVRRISELAHEKSVDVFVGYNRRYFASVECLRTLIAEDGGLQSLHFDFTEMAERIGRQERPAAVKARWLLANSTHVLDLAFHLGGHPVELSAYQSGGLEWHPSGSVFCGAGVTENGVSFSYGANWNAPGRWGLELFTAKRRFVLRPMELLQATSAALTAPEPVPIDDVLDRGYKPGLYQQLRAFFGSDRGHLCNIEEHLRRMPVYERIGGYLQ